MIHIEPSFEKEDTIFANIKVSPDYKNVLTFIDQLKNKLGEDLDIECGYEAGCLGYSLYHQLTAKEIKCVILAPTTMKKDNKRVKTDTRDALMIAQYLVYKGYKAVHIPTTHDNAVKEYLRMRDDSKNMLKTIKQQLIAFLTRNGKAYTDQYWTAAHMDWIKKNKFDETVLKETILKQKNGIPGMENRLYLIALRI